MTAACSTCADKGLVKVNWQDAPPDFALCICKVGLAMRCQRNNAHDTAPLWMVWCAREQVDPSRVFLLEDILTPEELRAAGLQQPATVGPLDAVAAMAKRKGPRP